MEKPMLSEQELNLILTVLSKHKDIKSAILFGSRANGKASAESDIDLALEGIHDQLKAETVASEFDELPLPYRFDVHALEAIKSQPLLDHITRVGIKIYG